MDDMAGSARERREGGLALAESWVRTLGLLCEQGQDDWAGMMCREGAARVADIIAEARGGG